MEIRFTASVIEAVEFMLGVLGGHQAIWPRGEAPGSLIELPRPAWCNFAFFSRILATPVRRVKRSEPTPGTRGIWELDRMVWFWHGGHRVAVVRLIGHKIDGAGDLDDRAFWAVSGVGYFRTAGTGHHESPADWVDYDCEVQSLCNRSAA